MAEPVYHRFGLSSWLPIALVLLAIAGWADIISEVLRSSILQLSTPDNLRGRITAMWLAQTNASPRLGDTEAGLMAALANAQISATAGGLACILGVVALSWQKPAFRHFQLEHAGKEQV